MFVTKKCLFMQLSLIKAETEEDELRKRSLSVVMNHNFYLNK